MNQARLRHLDVYIVLKRKAGKRVDRPNMYTQIESQDVINRLNGTAWELNESLLELIVTGVLGQGRWATGFRRGRKSSQAFDDVEETARAMTNNTIVHRGTSVSRYLTLVNQKRSS